MLEMQSLPIGDNGEVGVEIAGTPYEYEIWILERIAEVIAHVGTVENARSFYRPIFDRGAGARY